MTRILLAMTILTTVFVSAQGLAGGPIWPMPMHDCRHSCQSSFNGPSRANIAWSTFSDTLFPGPVGVAEDGTIHAIQWLGLSAGPLLAFDSAGTLKWSFNSSGHGMSVSLATDGTVYVPVNGLVALTPEGKVKWQVGGLDGYNPPTVGPDGTLYTCTYDSFCAVSPDGNLEWEYYSDGRKVRAPAVAPNGNVYALEDYWSNEIGRLLALDSKGNLLWERAVSGFEVSDLLAAPDSSVIFYSLTEGILYCCGTSGELKWSFKTGLGFVPGEGSASDPYLGMSESGTICFLAAKPWNWAQTNPPYQSLFFSLSSTGNLKWSLEIPGSPGYSSTAIGADGTIYVGTIVGGTTETLYSFQPDGTENWETEIGGASNLVIGGDGVLCLAHWGLTAIADYGTIQINLLLDKSWYYAGDVMRLAVAVENMAPSTNADFYLVVWDFEGNVYSWPTWQPGVYPGMQDVHIPYGTQGTLEDFVALTLPTDSPPINRQARYWFAVALTKPGAMDFLCDPETQKINFVADWLP